MYCIYAEGVKYDIWVQYSNTTNQWNLLGLWWNYETMYNNNNLLLRVTFTQILLKTNHVTHFSVFTGVRVRPPRLWIIYKSFTSNKQYKLPFKVRSY